MKDGAIRFGRYAVELSNTGKLFFPDDGITKGDLVGYYSRVSEVMLPYLRERPLVMQRFPDGIREPGFYHKDIPGFFPDWIDRVTVPREDGSLTHAVCNNRASLVYVANQGCVTPHVWLSQVDDLDHPDLLVFDLDPSSDDFGLVRRAALAVRALLDELGLAPFVQTTGSRGLHVVAPLDRSWSFDDVRGFARDVAGLVARQHPERFTVEQRKAKRGDRVYLDVMRNSYAQTIVCPYAVRARPGAPVATPVDWAEVERGPLTPQRYTIRNLFRRLGQKDDPWQGMWRHARSLAGPIDRLQRLAGS